MPAFDGRECALGLYGSLFYRVASHVEPIISRVPAKRGSDGYVDVEAASSYTEPTGKPLSRRPSAESRKKVTLLQLDKRPCQYALSPKPLLKTELAKRLQSNTFVKRITISEIILIYSAQLMGVFDLSSSYLN